MRLLIVTREYPDVTPYSGGIGSAYAVLAPELVSQGHEVHVLAITDGDPGDREIQGVYFHLVRSATPPSALHVLDETLWARKVDRALRRLGRFDAIVTAEWGAECVAYAMRRKRDHGPLVVMLTSSLAQLRQLMPGIHTTPSVRLRRAVQQRLEHAQAKRADGILALTDAILSWARRLWDIESLPTTIAPNLLNVDRVRTLSLESELPAGWPQDRGPVVAFSGRLEVRKGVHVLTEAMDTVWNEHPDAQLVLMGRDSGYGDGMMSDHIRKLAGKRADHLHLLGNQPSGTLFAGLRAADVVALPSIWENFAGAALETMAVGTCPVVTWGCGFQEFIRDGQDGLLVPPNDPPALSGTLTRLLSDQDLRERLGASAATSAEKYDAPVVTRQYVEFFEQIAARAA
jgi:glycosyltransferase involved in cell wall biosynthesis